MKKLLLFAMMLYAAGIFAQGNLGQAGANFLQIAPEPRGAALGGATTAITRGAVALYWNPAGAVMTENVDIYLANTDWFLDTKLAFAGVVKNMGAIGSFGLSVTSLYMDEMEITTVYESEGTGEYYDAGDLVVGLSYARSMTDRFSFGVTVKYVQEYIWNETADQLAFDVGSLYRTDFYNLRLGMSVRHFAGKLKFSGENIDQRIAREIARGRENNPRIERLTPDFRLPQVFQMGIAFDPLVTDMNRVTVLADVDVPSDNKERLIIGAEYAFRNFACIRGGYRINYDIGDFSLGGALALNALGMNAVLDYAWSDHGVFGDVHRIGLGLSF